MLFDRAALGWEVTDLQGSITYKNTTQVSFPQFRRSPAIPGCMLKELLRKNVQCREKTFGYMSTDFMLHGISRARTI